MADRPSASGHDAPSRPVALVTGGGTGLGLAVGELLAEDGYDLAIASRSADHLAQGTRTLSARGTRVIAIPTDVRDPVAVGAMIDRVRDEFGRLDVVVNNAAGNFAVRAEDLSPNGWRAVVGIVLDGTFFTSRAAFPLLKRSSAASIVNIVASYAWLAGPGTVHSAAAKAGVLTLTRTLAVEWARFGIRVNAVSPGPVHTEGTDRQLWLSSDLVQRVTDAVPMRRFGTPREIAEGVRFLVSPRASYITGQVLTIDGGQWLGRGVMELLEGGPGEGQEETAEPPPRRAPGA